MASYKSAGGASGPDLSDDAPLAVGTADEGVSEDASRADHVHAHGNQLGGVLHADASGAAAGFLTAAHFTKITDLPLAADLTTSLSGKASTTHAATHVTGSTDVIASAVASGNAGLMTGADKAKLDGISAGAAANKGIGHFRQVGTSPVERWHLASALTATQISAPGFSPGENQLYALPLLHFGGGTVDKLSVRVSAALTDGVRIGIYSATSATNLYPDALIGESGAIAGGGTNGAKTATGLSIVLSPDTFYWIAVVAEHASYTPNRVPLASAYPVFGTSNAFVNTPGIGWQVAFTYGTLPATFPSGAAVLLDDPHALAVHFSA